MDTVEIKGSHGTFEVDAATGIPLRGSDVPYEYAPFVRWDLDEWVRYWEEPLHEAIDVLDVGAWTVDGDYMPPEDDFRIEILREQEA